MMQNNFAHFLGVCEIKKSTDFLAGNSKFYKQSLVSIVKSPRVSNYFHYKF